MLLIDSPYPFESKIKRFLKRAKTLKDFKPTGLNKDYYLDLIEPFVRQAAGWQDSEGFIVDPFLKREQFHTTPRFVSSCSVLISTGRCLDLLDKCLLAMDAACRKLHEKSAETPDFYVRELVTGYMFLKKYASSKRIEMWKKSLGSFNPEDLYKDVLSKSSRIHNVNIYTLAGEQMKIYQGLANNIEYIERYIPIHLSNFTAYGMYQDPGNPITYDLSPRFNFSIMLYYGYEGKYRGLLDELLRRGGLTTLLYLSCNGQAPFGGRSNQYHFVEAMVSAICEYEAQRYYNLGKEKLAGAFKRSAHLAALSVSRWFKEAKPIRHIKNFFPPETMYGCDVYGGYAVYGLTAASFFTVAYLFANDEIDEEPAPIDVGGYVITLPEFHKVFSTVSGTHVEIDTKADHHYDATGLGRFHLRTVPSELALSSSITSTPKYIVDEPSPKSFAIGLMWLCDDEWRSLAEYESEIVDWSVEVLREDVNECVFRVTYSLSNEKVEKVISEYRLRSGVLEVIEEVSGNVSRLRVTIPLIITDGEHESEITVNESEFKVKYLGYVYQARFKGNEFKTSLLNVIASNRNAKYNVGYFETESKRAKYCLSITKYKKTS